jgi:hypothetical protein
MKGEQQRHQVMKLYDCISISPHIAMLQPSQQVLQSLPYMGDGCISSFRNFTSAILPSTDVDEIKKKIHDTNNEVAGRHPFILNKTPILNGLYCLDVELNSMKWFLDAPEMEFDQIAEWLKTKYEEVTREQLAERIELPLTLMNI